MKLTNRRQVLAGFAAASTFSMAGFHSAVADDGYIELTARAPNIKLKGQAEQVGTGPSDASIYRKEFALFLTQIAAKWVAGRAFRTPRPRPKPTYGTR